MKRFTLIATMLGLLASLTSQAAPVVSLSAAGELNTSVADATIIDFNDGCGYALCSGDFVIASGSLSGYYASPAGVDSPYLSVPNPSATTKTAEFSLGTLANYFGLYWGSIDAYNFISFYLNDTLVASYSGSDIVGQFADGNQISLSSNRYINFDFGSSVFDKVTLFSNGFAFESDNHAFKTIASLSEPAPALLMLLGLASLGLIRRRAQA